MAVGGPHALAAESLERLEQPLHFDGRDDGAGVADRQASAVRRDRWSRSRPRHRRRCGGSRSRAGSRPGSRPGLRRRSREPASKVASIWTPRRSASCRRLCDDVCGELGEVERLPALRPRARSWRASAARRSAAPAGSTARAPPRRSRAAPAASASGSASATCSRVRWPASGVRSSWEALATNWRWDSNDASRRPNRSSSVRPSSVSSSSGPSRLSRRSRLVAEISWAAVVIARSGRRNLPASHQAASTRDSDRHASTMQRTAPKSDWARCSALRRSRRARVEATWL